MPDIAPETQIVPKPAEIRADIAEIVGLDLEKNIGPEDKPIIISYKNNILGCAQYKEGKILNFLPKIHRGEVIL